MNRLSLFVAGIADSILRFYSKLRIKEVAGSIESKIGKKLIQAGFKTVDPRHLEKLRKKFNKSNTISGSSFQGIDLLITGTISLAARSSVGPMHQAICQIHCKVLRVDTGEIVYQDIVGNTFDVSYSNSVVMGSLSKYNYL